MRCAPWIIACALAVAVVGCDKEDEEPEKVEDDDDKKKDDDDDDEAPADSATAEPSATAANVTTTRRWTTTTTTTTTTNKPGASILPCCAALGSAARAEKNTAKKAKLKTAVAQCHGTAKLVKEGKTNRASALAQIRATAGGGAPAACSN